MIKINLQKSLMAAEGEMQLDLKLVVEKHQFVTLYGESGAGKTSTLRMLAGLMQPDSGRISVHENVWYDHSKNINIPPQKRKIGFVFQDYALFPNMTVLENLKFAAPKNQSPERIAALIEIIELGALQNRKPNTLSGGQQQRVALARALAQDPDILLLDEPLAALDLNKRLKLQDYLLKVHQAFNLTTLLISHDLAEIIKLSDKVFMLKNGKIINSGTPETLFIPEETQAGCRFTAEILKIEQHPDSGLLTILVQTNIIQIPVALTQLKDLAVGNKVVLVIDNFQPEVIKLDIG